MLILCFITHFRFFKFLGTISCLCADSSLWWIYSLSSFVIFNNMGVAFSMELVYALDCGSVFVVVLVNRFCWAH